jgi:hypothetical protein
MPGREGHPGVSGGSCLELQGEGGAGPCARVSGHCWLGVCGSAVRGASHALVWCRWGPRPCMLVMSWSGVVGALDPVC